MNHYTPLPLSRKIASLGVECESEKWWNTYFSHPVESHEVPYSLLENYSAFNGIPAYSLHELIPVLQAIGAVKGWYDIHYEHCPAIDYNDFCDPGECTCEAKNEWKSHFLEIARLYVDSPKSAWEYLDDLLS